MDLQGMFTCCMLARSVSEQSGRE